MKAAEDLRMLTGHHYQNAYVTRNLAKAVAEFEKRADIRKILQTKVSVPVWTPEGEGAGTQNLAFIWIGDMQYEIIEPGPEAVLSLYRDALPDDDRLVFHHICHRVDDWEAFLTRQTEQEFPIVFQGGSPEFLQFAYLDTRPWLGHYTEYVWMVPERWAQLGGI
jgi:catechol 2,3-dioxygenase-like lactoylglutathione lyase family enzyme